MARIIHSLLNGLPGQAVRLHLFIFSSNGHQDATGSYYCLQAAPGTARQEALGSLQGPWWGLPGPALGRGAKDENSYPLKLVLSFKACVPRETYQAIVACFQMCSLLFARWRPAGRRQQGALFMN